MLDINISAAERIILQILPGTRALEGGLINTKGQYLVFDRLEIDNTWLAELGYVFRLFVAIQSANNNKSLLYQPLSQALQALLTHWQRHQLVEVGRIKPNAAKGLLIYEVQLIYRPNNQEYNHVVNDQRASQ